MSPLSWGSSARWAPVARSHRGFSIMSVIVAAGLMAGLSLMLANLTRQQHVNQKKAETGLEISQLHHRILGVLYDGDACLVTLGKGSALQNERRITKLLNKGGKTVLETGVDINRQVRVKEMVIKNVTGTGRTKEAQMHITIKKLGEANKGTGDILKKFALTVELDTNGKVARCHHTLDSKEHAIHQNICESLGGKMEQRDGPTTECTLTDLFKTFCEGFGGRYEDPNPRTATVGKCKIDHWECPEGQFIQGFDGSGQVKCTSFISRVSKYDLSNDSGGIEDAVTHSSLSLGTHKICASSGYSGPGGFNTTCAVKPDGREVPTTWTLYLYDNDRNGQTQVCRAVCFD